jgi:hypothetical protein
MLQRPIVRAASAAIHVAWIALLISFAWQTLQLRVGIMDETGGTSNRIVAVLGVSLAAAMTIGLILWLKRNRIGILLICDLVLLALFGFVVWVSITVGAFEAFGVAAFVALAAALVPVLIDPRRQQRAAPPVYWPGYGPVVPSNPPRAPGSDERPAPPPA